MYSFALQNMLMDGLNKSLFRSKFQLHRASTRLSNYRNCKYYFYFCYAVLAPGLEIKKIVFRKS